jgi:hypothetical protein
LFLRPATADTYTIFDFGGVTFQTDGLPGQVTINLTGAPNINVGTFCGPYPEPCRIAIGTEAQWYVYVDVPYSGALFHIDAIALYDPRTGALTGPSTGPETFSIPVLASIETIYILSGPVECASSFTGLGSGCAPDGTGYLIVDYSDVPTPLPAALPLFATGLGALGLLGWRRKRKNAAAIAA